MKIKVIDHKTGLGLPLAQVRVKEAAGLTAMTDSRGVAAVHVPAFVGKSPTLMVGSFGFTESKKTVKLAGGKSETFRLKPYYDVSVADRLYQLTGGGTHRNSWIFGDNIHVENPLMNANAITHGPVTGTKYRGELVWFFNGTRSPSDDDDEAKLSGATSKPPEEGGLQPDSGVNFEYFTNSSGSARDLIPALNGETTTLKGLMIPRSDPSKLYAPIEVETARSSIRGIASWDHDRQQFRLAHRFPDDVRVKLCPNVTRIRTEGREWFYFACPLPLVRVPATPEAIQDLSRYETFTPVASGASWEGKHTERAEGNRWAWRSGTPTVDNPRERQLRRNFWFPRRAGIHHLVDLQTGEPFTAREGTVFWNEFRGKWVMITNEVIPDGNQQGNVFYAEADSPIGPWVYARKVANHQLSRDWTAAPYKGSFSLRDVQQQPHFTREEGRIIFFSGLFKRTNTDPSIPRYNENHLMYRLDLTDRRLHLPTPVYMNGNINRRINYGTARSRSDEQQDSGSVPFYAYPVDRHGISGDDPLFNQYEGTAGTTLVPVWEERRSVNDGPATGLTTERSSTVTSDTPVFYAWPADFSPDHQNLTELREYRHPSRSVLVYVSERLGRFFENNGWSFEGTVATVWRSPRLNPPTDASARPAPAPTFTAKSSSSSGNGGGSGGGCLVERSGVSPGSLASLRALRDRLLPTAPGRWITSLYYTL